MDHMILENPCDSRVFNEGVLLVAGEEASLDSLLSTRLPPEVAATRKFVHTNPAPTISACDFESDGSDVPFSPVLITEDPFASAT